MIIQFSMFKKIVRTNQMDTQNSDYSKLIKVYIKAKTTYIVLYKNVVRKHCHLSKFQNLITQKLLLTFNSNSNITN